MNVGTGKGGRAWLPGGNCGCPAGGKPGGSGNPGGGGLTMASVLNGGKIYAIHPGGNPGINGGNGGGPPGKEPGGTPGGKNPGGGIPGIPPGIGGIP